MCVSADHHTIYLRSYSLLIPPPLFILCIFIFSVDRGKISSSYISFLIIGLRPLILGISSQVAVFSSHTTIHHPFVLRHADEDSFPSLSLNISYGLPCGSDSLGALRAIRVGQPFSVADSAFSLTEASIHIYKARREGSSLQQGRKKDGKR